MEPVLQDLTFSGCLRVGSDIRRGPGPHGQPAGVRIDNARAAALDLGRHYASLDTGGLADRCGSWNRIGSALWAGTISARIQKARP